MPKKTVKTDQFYLESDDGRRFLTFELTVYETEPGFRSPPRQIEVDKMLKTFDGMHVNFDGKDLYLIVPLNLPVRRIE